MQYTVAMGTRIPKEVALNQDRFSDRLVDIKELHFAFCQSSDSKLTIYQRKLIQFPTFPMGLSFNYLTDAPWPHCILGRQGEFVPGAAF